MWYVVYRTKCYVHTPHSARSSSSTARVDVTPDSTVKTDGRWFQSSRCRRQHLTGYCFFFLRAIPFVFRACAGCEKLAQVWVRNHTNQRHNTLQMQDRERCKYPAFEHSSKNLEGFAVLPLALWQDLLRRVGGGGDVFRYQSLRVSLSGVLPVSVCVCVYE